MGIKILVVVLVLLIIYVLIIYNKLVSSRNLVKEAFSTMDVYLKKRWDLIPNLIEVVKGYASHEEKTLDKITDLRTKEYKDIENDSKFNVNEQISNELPKIMAIVENYPDLKSNKNFSELSSELVQIENDIANSRKYYNGTVRNYNNKIQVFPNSIIAVMFGFKENKMFEATEKEKNNVKVEL